MKETISPRQAALTAFAASSAPVITVCAAAPPVWTLALSVAVGLLAWRLIIIWYRAREDLASLTVALLGKKLGTALLVLAAIFAALTLAQFAAWTDTAFPETDTKPFVPLVLLAIAAWSAWKGSAACIRAVAVTAFLLAAIYAVVFIFAMPDAEPSRLLSADADFSPALCVLRLPLTVLWFSAPAGGRSARTPLAATALLPVLTAAVCAMVPGSGGSFYVMAESVNVLSVGSRIEPLVSAALTAGWFAAMCLPVLAAGRIAETLCGRFYAGVLLCTVAAVPAAVLGMPETGALFSVGAAIFCGVLPLVILEIGAKKKT